MRNFGKTLFLLLLVMTGLFAINACHKDPVSTKGALSFSSDTLTFDTVFTTLGSTTKYFKVRNTQSKAVIVSDMKLMQLQGSQFRINVDGISGTEFKNVEIPAHDSIYVFVEVTINPNTANNPFVIIDKVQFQTNGVTQNVVLEAMGQNAYYHFSDSITPSSAPWLADKPHIIINKNGGLPILEVQAGATLNIPPHCQIYMAPNAVITVDGTLNAVANNWTDSIGFHYIRLDYDYHDKPGQWLGITYSRTASITMSHVIIDQSTFGLSDEHVLNVLFNQRVTTSSIKNYTNAQLPSVNISNSIIRNCSNAAMWALCTQLTATNCLFHSGGGNMVVLGVGGNYTVQNCTFANVNNTYTSHQAPTLTLIDQIIDIDNTKAGPLATSSNIQNTAVVGTLPNELQYTTPPTSINSSFQNCLITISPDSFHILQPNDNGSSYIGDPQYLNPPLFVSSNNNNYMPDSTTSLLSGKGISNGISIDLFDYPRNNPPSIGAIEWHH